MNKDLSSALKRIGDFFFTRRCSICGEVVELDDELCSSCLTAKRIELPRCQYCGASKERCSCRKNKNEYASIVAPFYYEDSIANAVNRCKSSNMPFLAKEFARQMYSCIEQEYFDIEFDYITFIPMSNIDLLKRGFNQSELIAKELSDLTGIECRALLKKVRRTKPQKEQSAKKRLVNVYGAFDLSDKESVRGKTILIVDDVKTTGSTLNECSKMLKIYDAKAVYASVFAIIPPKRNQNNG